MKLRFNNLVELTIADDGTMLVNGNVPQIHDVGNGRSKLVCQFYQSRNPKKVIGARKRKKALYASLKKFEFSTYFIKG
jgi:hypothetical protein